MFDTSLVRPRSRGLGFLPVSLVLHSAVVVAAIAASIATVDFPRTAPDQLDVYTPVVTPAMPPLPLGRPAPPKPAQTVAAPVSPPAQVLAPLPETDGAPVSSPAPAVEAAGGTDAGAGPIGDPDGDPWGIDAGQAPGGTGIGTGTAPAGPLFPGGNVTSARVLRRVEPRYPAMMVQARISAVVTVRCVIGRDGRVRDPEIIRSSYPPFNDAVRDAVQKWSFAPGTLNGDPVDTWFELTVSFKVR
ncbi:MAG TPA: TonB family protein [Thermoanaerobaculia bacterium]|nr:TonB family protein [Thermoanaerobaculia bacterium]